MFRNLIPALADKYHVVAPDYPGFGNSSAPSVEDFDYTFDNLANVVEKFTEKVGLKKYSVYLMDYGAPVGFRLAVNEFTNDMVVRRGNDSTTWNVTAGAWNKLRDGWFSLMYDLGLLDAVEHMCPGKVLRLMAADVAWWHRQSGGDVHPDTFVWQELPRLFESVSRPRVSARANRYRRRLLTNHDSRTTS